MKKSLYIALILSLGLNAGLLFIHFTGPLGLGVPPPPFLRGSGLYPDGPPPEEGRRSRWMEGDRPVLDRVMEHRMGRMAEHLGLDATQRDEMSAVIREMIPLILDAKEGVAVAREAMRDEYLKAEIDPDSVREARADLNARQGTLDSLVAETMLRESMLLTQDQRESYMRSMPWERHFGPGHGEPGGPDDRGGPRHEGGPHHGGRGDGSGGGRGGDGRGGGGG